MHADFNAAATDAVNYFNIFKEQFDIERIALQSVPIYCGGDLHRLQNLKILMIKDMMYPYAFAGMGLYSGEGHEPFEVQLENALAQGFDSVKMLEGKPDTRRDFGRPICDESLDPFYDMIEQKELMLLMHLADPFESWDKSTCDKWALEHGRCYDAPGFLKPEELYAEAEQIIIKHPNIKIVFAHFFFLAEYLDEAAAFLDKYPNVMFDLTPGKHYEIFSKPEHNKKAQEFYIKYANRLIFGTDVNDSLTHTDGGYHKGLYGMAIGMVNGNPIPAFRNVDYVSLNLPDDVANKILYENHKKLLGDAPKRINKAAVLEEIARIEKEYDALCDADRQALLEVKEYFAK